MAIQFLIAEVASSMNTAAYFLSRKGVDPTEKLAMTIRNEIHTKAIKTNIQSSGIVEEDEFYILLDEAIDRNQLWEEKQNVRNQAQTETHNDAENAISELQQFHKPTSALISVSPGYVRDNARTRLEQNEQNNDIVLRNLRVKIDGDSFDEIQTSDINTKQNSSIVQDGISVRKTSYRWIFYQTSLRVEAMTISSPQ